jgi:hypothetical protein
MEKLLKMRENAHKLFALEKRIDGVLCELEDTMVELISDSNYDAVLDEVYVIYNHDGDYVFEFANKRDVILYGSVEEAMEDNKGILSSLSRVMKACDIPKKWREKIIHQLKHN